MEDETTGMLQLVKAGNYMMPVKNSTKCTLLNCTLVNSHDHSCLQLQWAELHNHCMHSQLHMFVNRLECECGSHMSFQAVS